MAKNKGCIYGVTGTYKSYNLGRLAKYIFAKTKKRVRLVTADPGGHACIQHWINGGIIEILDLTMDAKRLILMDRIVEGYWPIKIVNGFRVGTEMLSPLELDNIGGYIFEGITTLASAMHTLYVGKDTGMKTAYSEVVPSEFTTKKPGGGNSLVPPSQMGGYSLDSYGLIQGHMTRKLNYSWTLPVEYVWWSGHDLLVEPNDKNKLSHIVTGIQLVGNAGANALGKNIGTLIHAYRHALDGGKMEVRFHYQPHVDNQHKGVNWDAKPRIIGDYYPKLAEAFPNGYFVPGYDKEGNYVNGLDTYVAKEEEFLGKGEDEVKKFVDSVLNTTTKETDKK